MVRKLLTAFLMLNLFVHAGFGQEDIDSDERREEARQLVSFYYFSLNVLGDPGAAVSEKETIIQQSYQKIFKSPEVQIEDDLDTARQVVLYKDVQAYLKDVEFFFKAIRFDYEIDSITAETGEKGIRYLKIKLNQQWNGINHFDDSLKKSSVRYIEVGLNEQSEGLQIASIYTTKLNRDELLVQWWNELPAIWQNRVGERVKVTETVDLSDVKAIGPEGFRIEGGALMPANDIDWGKVLTSATKVDSLDFSDSEINDLQPIEQMDALVYLNIQNTTITDLQPLRYTSKLKNFNAAGSSISGIGALKFNLELQKLDISETGVDSLQVVRKFPKLTYLDASNTSVTDLSPLSELKQLRYLDVANTRVLHLVELQELTRIETLNVANTQISDLAPIGDFEELEKLDISGITIQSMDVFSKLKNLKALIADNSNINSLEVFENLENLKTIFADNADVTDEHVRSWYNQKANVNVIYKTARLESWWNDMGGLWQKAILPEYSGESPPSRELLHEAILTDSIHFADNQSLTDIQPVEELLGVKYLDISGTGVSSLDPLKNHADLQYLDISKTSIISVEVLEGKEKLKTLKAEYTGVSDLSALSGLPSLRALYFDSAAVKEISVINALPGFRIGYFDHCGITATQMKDWTFHEDSAIVVFRTQELRDWWGNLPDVWQDIFRDQYDMSRRPDREALHQLTGRHTLEFQSVIMKGLKPVMAFQRLKSLSFSDSQISSLQPLSVIATLEKLHCPRNPVGSLEPLQLLSELKEVNIEQTPIQDLSPLQNANKMEKIIFNSTEIKDISVLANMPELRVIEMANTPVRNLKEIEELSNLELVRCFNTRISDKRVESFKKAQPNCQVVYY
jgi:Leucine-rich repeat (LRR) protein